jgi:serine/threonine protein phosphatase 1
MRRLVVGDVHGNMEGLMQALEAAQFNEEDLLIGIGDYVDGHKDSLKVIQYLESLGDRFIGVEGNHDTWFINFIKSGSINKNWFYQGGKETLDSFGIKYNEKIGGVILHTPLNECIDPKLKDWFDRLKSYIELDEYLFVHGGIGYAESLMGGIDKIPLYYLNWNREMWETAISKKTKVNLIKAIPMLDKWSHIFIGHTALREELPITAHHITNLDTNGGFKGKVTIMDIDTKEYWQSESNPYRI